MFVEAQSALDADVTIRYQVADASWTPIYDVRLETGGKTTPPSFALTRRASIAQNSGEIWQNITLTLSTTRPSAGASAPELQPIRVDIEQPLPPLLRVRCRRRLRVWCRKPPWMPWPPPKRSARVAPRAQAQGRGTEAAE